MRQKSASRPVEMPWPGDDEELPVAAYQSGHPGLCWVGAATEPEKTAEAADAVFSKQPRSEDGGKSILGYLTTGSGDYRKSNPSQTAARRENSRPLIRDLVPDEGWRQAGSPPVCANWPELLRPRAGLSSARQRCLRVGVPALQAPTSKPRRRPRGARL